MMHGHEKSDPAIVAGKLTNKSGAICCGVGGAKGRDQGECEPAKHALDSVPVKRVTGVGSHTAPYCRQHPRWEKLWGGRRRLWHLHRPNERWRLPRAASQ
jgi:hypothetical protein